MVRLNRIYTRTGDAGETGLVDGSRVSKADPRVAAYGDVDETNSAIGLALTAVTESDIAAMLGRIQNELFDLGADLATPADSLGADGFEPGDMALRIVQSQIDRLEAEIDAMNAHLEPLRSFILPAGGGGAAALHLARAIARRAERSAVIAAAQVALNPAALTDLTRLADQRFVAARLAASREGGEILWKPGATR